MKCNIFFKKIRLLNLEVRKKLNTIFAPYIHQICHSCLSFAILFTRSLFYLPLYIIYKYLQNEIFCTKQLIVTKKIKSREHVSLFN